MRRVGLSVVLTVALALGAATFPTPGVAAKKPKPAKERRLDASFQATITAAPGQVTRPTAAITMWVPKGVRAAGAKIPSCDPARLQAEGPGACPPGAQVGAGSGTALILRGGRPSGNETLTVTLFNGPGGTLLALTRGTAPVPIDAVVQATVGRAAGGAYGYGQVLRFPFPDALVHPQPDVVASMSGLKARLDARTGWLRSTSCPRRGWSLGALLTSVDGGEISLMADLACV